MGIVSDDNVSTALRYLAEHPHPASLAHKDLLDAEVNTKTVEGELYLLAEGTVDERWSQVRTHPRWLLAKGTENKASGELEAHKRREKAAHFLLEVWRTENANARVAEKVR
jgi:hypothetical protein